MEPILTTIKRQGKIPLHKEAERKVRQLIAQSKYQKGELLPNEVELAEVFGISRQTLRMALGRLVNEGILVRTAGLGTRVCTQPVRTDVNAWSSFTREMQKRGLEVENFEIQAEMVEVSSGEAERLGVPVGTQVLRISRLRGWSGRPTMKSVSWLHPDLGLTGNEDYSCPLYEMVQKACGVRPVRSVEEVSVASADKDLAKKLSVKLHAPLLMRKRLVFDQHDKPLEYNVNSYLPDAYTLHLELQVNHD